MWIKICGVTRIEDALAVVKAGASAMGLNFFQGSKRFVSVGKATTIAGSLRRYTEDRAALDLVGVFVNATVPEIVDVAKRVGLTAVQFHGDESADLIAEFHAQLPTIHIVRALRVLADTLDQQLNDVDLLNTRVPLAACLLDAFVAGEYGGTGMTIDLQIPKEYLAVSRPRLILAGGLTAENVGGIISEAKPWGVDTASGVESSPGVKDCEKCRLFVQSALGKAESLSVRL